jgi:stearoyl-CoA desaturase (Delta-9 desaturase)
MTDASPTPNARAADERIRLSSAPFFVLHLFALGIFLVPFSWDCVVIFVAMYYLRMFGITAGYHRYFAHRGFKTGRVFQFVLAWLGLMSSQKGVLWWSGHHRHHHKYSDLPEDIHSPKRGFWWSHMFWILVPRYEGTPDSQLREFQKFPELVFINKHWWTGPTFLGFAMFAIGGTPWLFWGFFLSTVVLWHGTFTINSLAHVWGRRRYETTDTSRNNMILSLITMGEGWHNNHHFYQSTANNGFFWWEIDMSYYILKALSWVGVVWDLRTPPAWVLEGKKRANEGLVQVHVMPASVLQAIEAVHALRAQIEQAAAEAEESAAALRDRLAQRAAEVAESASKAAHEAADAARQTATDLRARFAEAAESAAQAAREASDAASKMAAELKTRVSVAAAEAAERAAKTADEAAERAAAYVAGMSTAKASS